MQEWRACYVLECGGGLAQEVISTIGQAFELRFKEFLTKPSSLQLVLRHSIFVLTSRSLQEIRYFRSENLVLRPEVTAYRKYIISGSKVSLIECPWDRVVLYLIIE